MAKEIIKAGSKTGTTKNEPAGPKKGRTAQAAPAKDGKKKPPKETATPAPVPDTASLALQKLKNENMLLQRDKVKFKERAEQAEQTIKNWVDNVGDAVGNTAEDVAGFGEKVNKQTSRKWVGEALLLLLLIAISFAVVYRVQRDNSRHEYAVHLQKDAIKKQRQDSAAAATQKALDSARTILDSYGRPDTTLAGKKKPRN